MAVLMPIEGIPHFHADPKHPHHNPWLQLDSREWLVFVDGEEIKECTGFDIVNGFATYYAKDAMGQPVVVGEGKRARFRIARRKGVVTVFRKSDGPDSNNG